MRWAYLIIGLAMGVILTLLSSHALKVPTEGKIQKWYFPSYPLSEPLDKIESLALMGDVKSSNAILNKINDCSTIEVGTGNISSACVSTQRYWQLVDAENGGTLGMSILFNDLSASKNCSDKIRAVFWLNRIRSLDKSPMWVSEERRLLAETAECR